MNLEKGKIIELEDNIEYYIIDKIELHEKIYLYISKLKPESGYDLRFVEFKENRVYPVLEEAIIKRLFLIVGKKGCE